MVSRIHPVTGIKDEEFFRIYIRWVKWSTSIYRLHWNFIGLQARYYTHVSRGDPERIGLPEGPEGHRLKDQFLFYYNWAFRGPGLEPSHYESRHGRYNDDSMFTLSSYLSYSGTLRLVRVRRHSCILL